MSAHRHIDTHTNSKINKTLSIDWYQEPSLNKLCRDFGKHCLRMLAVQTPELGFEPCPPLPWLAFTLAFSVIAVVSYTFPVVCCTVNIPSALIHLMSDFSTRSEIRRREILPELSPLFFWVGGLGRGSSSPYLPA